MNKKHSTKMTILLCILSLMALCLSLVACGVNKMYSVTIADYDETQGTVTIAPESEDGTYKKDTEITVTVTPNEGYALDTFKLSTEDENKTLDDEGKFVFKVQEDTTITVTFKSTVVPVESVTLDEDTLELEVGGRTEDASATLVATVKPDNATDKTVTWTSSDPTIATVEGGNVTALTAGETTITATAGGKSATCTVTVTQHNHNFGAWVDEVPATCVATGTKAHKQCTLCEKNFDNTDKEITELTIPLDANAHHLVAQVGEEGHWQECDRDGCDYKGNVTPHNFNGAMVNKGETGHANKCSVEGCTYESAVTAHTLKINDDKTKFECEQCEYEVAHTHNLDTVSAGESGHKDVCKTEGCGYESAVTAHSLKINDDKTKFVCEQCKYEEEHEHSLQLQNEGTQGHKKVCKTEGCGYESEVIAHTSKDDKWYSNEENTKHFKLCECDAHLEEDDHFATSYIYDKEGDMTTGQHYKFCEDCGQKFEIGNHQKSEKAEGTDAGHHYVCTVCKFAEADQPHSNPSGKYEPDTEASGRHHHYYLCSECDKKVSEIGATSRDYSKPDGEYESCSKCGFSEKLWDHKFNYVADEDGMHHSKCTNQSCTYKTESESCKNAVDQEGKSTITWTQATEDPSTGHTGKCVCGNDIALEAHDTEGEDGRCSKCGYKDLGKHTCVDNTATLEKDGKMLTLTDYRDGLCDVCGQQLESAVWSVTSGKLTLTLSYQSDANYKKVVVPAKIPDLTYTKVAMNKNINITDVIIPGTIYVDNQAFSGCSALQHAVILSKGDSSGKLPSNLFKDCKALSWVVVSAEVTSINDTAFSATTSQDDSGAAQQCTIYFMGTSAQWQAMISKLVTTKSSYAFLTRTQTIARYLNDETDSSSWHWESDEVIPHDGKKSI